MPELMTLICMPEWFEAPELEALSVPSNISTSIPSTYTSPSYFCIKEQQQDD